MPFNAVAAIAPATPPAMAAATVFESESSCSVSSKFDGSLRSAKVLDMRDTLI